MTPRAGFSSALDVSGKSGQAQGSVGAVQPQGRELLLQDPSDDVFEWSIPAHGTGESKGGKQVLE